MQPEPAHTPVEISRRERTLLLIAGAFLVAGTITLIISRSQPLLSNPLLALVVWIACFAGAHVFLHRRLPSRDPFLLPAAALLTAWGLLLIGRLAPNFILRQTVWLLVSTGAFLGVVHLSYDRRWLRRFRYTWLLGGLALLAITLLFGVNPSGFGPRLWLGALDIYFQPAELTKLLMIVYLASYLAERRELLITTSRKIGRWHLPPLAYVGPLLAMFGLAVILLAWQQDLGAAMLFFFTFLAMLYLATGQWEYVAAGLAMFLAIGAAGYLFSDKVALRVDGWINPWPEAAGRTFQIVQSLLAFGAGGLFGRGLGLGSPTYIPVVHSDFVFAAAAEEFGLAGILVIISLYVVLQLRGFQVAARARQPFDRFLAAGLTAGLAIQAWVIMAGNARLAPISGVTLPFVSYGGSSILISTIALALLLRISDCAPPRLPAAPDTNQQLLQIARVLLGAMVVLAATCGFWAVAQADTLRSREDNPRRVLYEQRVIRGRILDRQGTILADVAVADDGTVTRLYPIPEAAPALGYASLRYGAGGIEAAFDSDLRGEAGRGPWQAAWDDLLHSPPQGHDVRLTLDAELQIEAQRALTGHAGAVVLIDVVSGDVLVLASSPTFNPAHLDDTWEQLSTDDSAPLVNRATQGLYQPGASLETMIMAEALATGLADPDTPAPTATDPVEVNGTSLACSQTPDSPYTLGTAYAGACPAPFADLGQGLGTAGLNATIARWALTGAPPPFEIATEAADWSSQSISTTAALRSEAIGQGSLTVSPLQMALAAGTLANDGTRPAARLVLEVQDTAGIWHPHPSNGEPEAVLTAAVAGQLLAVWEPYGGQVIGHWGIAIAGEEQPPHAWFLAVAPAGSPQYAIAVLIEHPSDPEQTVNLGRTLLEMVQE